MFWSSWGGFGGIRRETVVHDRGDRVMEDAKSNSVGDGTRPVPRFILHYSVTCSPAATRRAA